MPPPGSPPVETRLEQLVTEISGLTPEVSLDRVLQKVADIAKDLLGARYAAFGLLGPDATTLEAFYTAGISREARAHIGPPPRGHGILGLVIKEARIIRLADLTRHPASAGFPPHHPPMRSFLGVPVVGRHGILGDLYLAEKEDAEEFTSEDEHIALLLARSAAAAIENARLHEESARLLAEVHTLHRTRERFFAMVNHELRNALAAVYGWAELMVRKKEEGTVPRAAYEVLDSASQAIALINDLLDLARLDEDRLKPVLREVQCAAMLRAAVSRVHPEAEAAGVTIAVMMDHDPGGCLTDATRVEQILVNLLRNAVAHSPRHGEIRITVAIADAEVQMLVEDDGPGIPADRLDQVFDIYETKNAGTHEGVGLGLPLSRRLARLLGGDLDALPNDGGGLFRLTLPLALPTATSADRR